ncbi:hypothetical protein AB3Z07_27790 (plasmid) [Metabacillus halosaccharovorans]|uniref:hypothetical protein n=1 Tax=Metabacillus halosaccharovorans TaxID=930124 RepID=UPI00203FB41B|nr:hypothetical protein [Metabacillus halosaccharovorans]MCM3441364.1 hypothetical protein [Metabacillus halosaccharovorans]
MVELDIRELLEGEFEGDNVRKEITYAKLEEDLYTDGILSMHPDTTYSTTEAAKIIGRSDSTIRNYFRTDLDEYIEAERHGKFYRLNYKSIFKLHMILLLIEKAGKSTSDISYFVGISPSVSVSNGKRTGRVINEENSVDEYNNRLKQMEEVIKHFHYQIETNSNHLKYLTEKDKLSSIKEELDFLDSQLINAELRKDQLELKRQLVISEEKNYRLLDMSLRNTQQNKSSGFIGNLLSAFKGQEQVDVEKVILNAKNEAEKIDASAKSAGIEQEIQKIQQDIESIREKKVKIKEMYDQQKSITDNSLKMIEVTSVKTEENDE